MNHPSGDRPPVRPFTQESATLKVRKVEDAWNTHAPAKVALAYTRDNRWRNRAEFLHDHPAIDEFLTRKWAQEHECRLIKELGLVVLSLDRLCVLRYWCPASPRQCHRNTRHLPRSLRVIDILAHRDEAKTKCIGHGRCRNGVFQQNGFQAEAKLCRGIFRAWRNLGEHFTMDQAMPLHFAELLRQHLLGDTGQLPVKLREALWSIEQMIEDDRFPKSGNAF